MRAPSGRCPSTVMLSDPRLAGDHWALAGWTETPSKASIARIVQVFIGASIVRLRRRIVYSTKSAAHLQPMALVQEIEEESLTVNRKGASWKRCRRPPYVLHCDVTGVLIKRRTPEKNTIEIDGKQYVVGAFFYQSDKATNRAQGFLDYSQGRYLQPHTVARGAVGAGTSADLREVVGS